jgi:hypothetical protein
MVANRRARGPFWYAPSLTASQHCGKTIALETGRGREPFATGEMALSGAPPVAKGSRPRWARRWDGGVGVVWSRGGMAWRTCARFNSGSRLAASCGSSLLRRRGATEAKSKQEPRGDEGPAWCAGRGREPFATREIALSGKPPVAKGSRPRWARRGGAPEEARAAAAMGWRGGSVWRFGGGAVSTPAGCRRCRPSTTGYVTGEIAIPI